MTAPRKALKSLGQNFLVDRNIIDRILRCADVGKKDNVLEIGPGRGALTGCLAQGAGHLLLVEYDHLLASALKERFRDDTHVTVIDGDVLRLDLEGLLGEQDGKWIVVANLPYNISTQVLFRLLGLRGAVSRMVLMLQREVGERLVASPGSADYGVTTLLLGLWFDIRREFIVAPGCFRPRPRVESALLSFVPLSAPRVDVGDEALFRKVVKGAFAMRRKTLANCLKAAELLSADAVDPLLEQCGIDGRRRGETLSMEEFAAISRILGMTASPS